MPTVLNEIVEKSASLNAEERRKLIEMSQNQEPVNAGNQKQNNIDTNTLWVKKHRPDYQGRYVALENGELVGQGKNFPEAEKDAKQNGSVRPFITYIFPLESEPFGGW